MRCKQNTMRMNNPRIGTHFIGQARSVSICSTVTAQDRRNTPMLLTVKGLVIRETAYGESDKIIDILTENGLVTFRARGVRKNGSKYAALTQLFAYAEYCLRDSNGRCFLDSAEPISLFYGIRNDLEALSLASYFAELTQKIATAQSQPQILRLFLHCLHYLSEHTRPVPLIKSIFELRLVSDIGMMPDVLCCRICCCYLPAKAVMRMRDGFFLCEECTTHLTSDDMRISVGTLRAVRHIALADFDRLFHIRLGETEMCELSLFTERYLITRLEMRCKTLQFYHALTAQNYDSCDSNDEMR